MWDGIRALTESLDENARNVHSAPSGLGLSHRPLMLNLAVFECHVPLLVSFFNHSIQGRLVGGVLSSRAMY